MAIPAPSIPAPSQFAALLRRSKFASFDPHIDQVYTTFDGHAARGNFGLKRPLALRRRNAHVTVSAVDSREQQTVWQSAEQKNRWIRMWDEVGVTVKVPNHSPWFAKLGARAGEVNYVADSEFTEKVGEMKKMEENEERLRPRSNAIPNTAAMSQDEFKRYLERIRELRPAFQEYLAQEAAASGRGTVSDFLQLHAHEQYHKPRPRHIEQQPHRFAGLSYSHVPAMQTLYTTKPQRGRVLGVGDRSGGSTVGFAGKTSNSTDGERGADKSRVTTFRYRLAQLSTPPVVVGPQPSGLAGVTLSTSVYVDSDTTRTTMRPNSHIPGSREYVGHAAVEGQGNMFSSSSVVPGEVKQLNPSNKSHVPAQHLLSSLERIGLAYHRSSEYRPL